MHARGFARLAAHKVSNACLALLLLVEAGGDKGKQEWSMEESKRPRMRARTAMSKDHRATLGRASTRDVARERASARGRVSGGKCKGAGSNARGGSWAKGAAKGENLVGTKTKASAGAEICRYIYVWVYSD